LNGLLISSLTGRCFVIFADKIGIGIAIAVGISIEIAAGKPGKPMATVMAIPKANPMPSAFFRFHCLHTYELISKSRQFPGGKG
jgi:hypothetical protein